MTMTGGCLCGSLRYEAEGEPSAIGKCYCTDCQKESGTGHMTFVAFPADAIKRLLKFGALIGKAVRHFAPISMCPCFRVLEEALS